jgi:outer membrane protein assembly factor BamB
MTIDLYRNRIYHYDENENLKQHFGFSTKFSHFEVLKSGKLLVIENYFEYKNGTNSNLYCLNDNFKIEWFAEIGENQAELDKYVGLSIVGEKIFANTWNGFRIELDIKNGKILDRIFTK